MRFQVEALIRPAIKFEKLGLVSRVGDDGTYRLRFTGEWIDQPHAWAVGFDEYRE